MPTTVSWRGALHSLAFFVGTLGLTAASIVFARRAAWQRETAWVGASLGCAFAIPALIVAATALGVQGATGAGVVYILIPVVACAWQSAVALHAWRSWAGR